MNDELREALAERDAAVLALQMAEERIHGLQKIIDREMGRTAAVRAAVEAAWEVLTTE